MSGERFTMTVTLQVTEPQALALTAMFNHWNRLASWGSSRFVGFYVDGDGDFKPRACVSIHAGYDKVRFLTEEHEKAAMVSKDGDPQGIRFDYDPIGWMISDAKRDAIRQASVGMDQMEAGNGQRAPEAMGEVLKS